MAYINGKEIFFGLRKTDVKKEELTVEPKTTAQTFEPEEGAHYSKVNVSAMKLSTLNVTENGTYTAGGIEYGKEYIFKNEFSQEELKTLFDAAQYRSEDGASAFIYSNGFMLGVMFATREANGNTVSVYLPYWGPNVWFNEEAAEVVESVAGWNYTEDLETFTPIEAPPSITLDETGELYVSDISALAPLFEQQAVHGFSSVVVNVEGGSGSADVVNVTFIGSDGAVLYVKPCIVGDDCYDPVITGKIETPAKESTVEYTYSYSGWSLTEGGADDFFALSEVTENRTVYAAFIENIVYYTVRFFNGDELVETVQVPYGETAIPTVNVENDGYLISGYEPSNENIIADTDCYIQWIIDDGYIHDSYADIVRYANNGQASSRYKVGHILPQVPITFANGTVENMDFVVADFGKVTLADGTTKDNITFVARNTSSYYGTVDLHPSGNTFGVAYKDTDFYAKLNNDVYNGIPSDLREGIKQRAIYPYDIIYKTNAYVWLLSVEEIGAAAASSNADTTSTQFSLFTDNNSRIRHLNGTETAKDWWTRSYHVSSNMYLYYVVSSSGAKRTECSPKQYRYGIVFGFCI